MREMKQNQSKDERQATSTPPPISGRDERERRRRDMTPLKRRKGERGAVGAPFEGEMMPRFSPISDIYFPCAKEGEGRGSAGGGRGSYGIWICAYEI